MLFADLQCWFTVKPEKKEERIMIELAEVQYRYRATLHSQTCL